MAIELDTRRIRTSSGNTSKSATERAATPASPRSVFAPPERAHVNFIPSPDSLRTLIQSAIAALRAGVFWDRGTILNLLV